MLFDVPCIHDWKQIGEYKQCQTDRSYEHENKPHVNFDYKVSNKALIRKDGILIQMELSGFNAEPNWKESIFGE
jgi:hypothetical protein